MSLIRRVSLLMVLVVLLALVGGVFTTLIAARDTLQTQLSLKNRDNAQSLALALSQQRGDVALMELVLAAQFDTGHYRSIVLSSSDGRAPFRREADAAATVAPAWFVRGLPLRAEPGVAQVSDGWRSDRTHRVGEPVGLCQRRVVACRIARRRIAGAGGLGRRRLGGMGPARDSPAAGCRRAASAGAAGRALRHRAGARRGRVAAARAQHEHDGRSAEHDVRRTGQAGREPAPAGADRSADRGAQPPQLHARSAAALRIVGRRCAGLAAVARGRSRRA